jgi:gamma-glutamyltranspeptidase/glutathione hydrolase
MVLLDPKLIVSLLVKDAQLDDTHRSRENGKLFMVVGTPGGSTIITSVLTILNVSEFNMSMQEAVNAPRFHHQWLPDEITFEPDSFDKGLLEK